MSATNIITIPTAQDVAAAVVAQLADMGMIVPGGSLDINEAAAYLKCAPKQVRRLVERGKLKAANLSTGTGEKAKLRFSVVVLSEYLKGD